MMRQSYARLMYMQHLAANFFFAAAFVRKRRLFEQPAHLLCRVAPAARGAVGGRVQV